MPAPVKVSLKTLIRQNGPGPARRALNSQVQQINLRPGGRRFIFLVKSNETYSSPYGHIVSVLYPNLPKFATLKDHPKYRPFTARVRVFCSCPAWRYTGPAFWSTEGKYRLPESKYVETRYPEIRDPDGKNRICKHVVLVAYYLSHYSFPRLFLEHKLPKSKAEFLEKKALLLNSVAHDLRLPNLQLPNFGLEQKLQQLGAIVWQHPLDLIPDTLAESEVLNALPS